MIYLFRRGCGMSHKVKLICVYAGLCIICIALYAITKLNILHMFCPFYKLTNLRCPACGNTRAILAVLRGDFREAFRFNYMFIPETAVILYICAWLPYAYIYKKTAKQKSVTILFCLAIYFVIWGIIRNLFNI